MKFVESGLRSVIVKNLVRQGSIQGCHHSSVPRSRRADASFWVNDSSTTPFITTRFASLLEV
jgi:hypothetical protein